MPSCVPESWKDSSCRASRTVRARRSPAAARVSISARSTVTRPNSATTKNALPAVSSTKAASGSTAVRNRPSMIGSPRPSFCRTNARPMCTRARLLPPRRDRRDDRLLDLLLERPQQDRGDVDDLDVLLFALRGHAVADHRVAERTADRDRLGPGGQRFLGALDV